MMPVRPSSLDLSMTAAARVSLPGNRQCVDLPTSQSGPVTPWVASQAQFLASIWSLPSGSLWLPQPGPGPPSRHPGLLWPLLVVCTLVPPGCLGLLTTAALCTPRQPVSTAARLASAFWKLLSCPESSLMARASPTFLLCQSLPSKDILRGRLLLVGLAGPAASSLQHCPLGPRL